MNKVLEFMYNNKRNTHACNF